MKCEHCGETNRFLFKPNRKRICNRCFSLREEAQQARREQRGRCWICKKELLKSYSPVRRYDKVHVCHPMCARIYLKRKKKFTGEYRDPMTFYHFGKF